MTTLSDTAFSTLATMIQQDHTYYEMAFNSPTVNGTVPRTGSSINETIIINRIMTYNLTNTPIVSFAKQTGSADWYDLAVHLVDGTIQYSNIKNPKTVIKTGTCDNAGSMMGIAYAATGSLPPENKEHSAVAHVIKYLKTFPEYNTELDYHFLVVPKDEPNHCFYRSLKQVHEYKLNGSNKPFQINWANEYRVISGRGKKRTWVPREPRPVDEHSIARFLRAWIGSDKLKRKIHDAYDEMEAILDKPRCK